jgi:hypothetical protein
MPISTAAARYSGIAFASALRLAEARRKFSGSTGNKTRP